MEEVRYVQYDRGSAFIHCLSINQTLLPKYPAEINLLSLICMVPLTPPKQPIAIENNARPALMVPPHPSPRHEIANCINREGKVGI
jgi:hypothetical protein